MTTPAPPVLPPPVELLVRRDLRRSRCRVLFRLLLAIPHVFVLLFLGIAAGVVGVVGWFAALMLGRLPRWAHEFLTGWLRWSARVGGYLNLLTDTYPPFTFAATDHPIRVVVPPPGPLNRWAVLGRIVLVVPAYALGLASAGMNLFVVFAWFAGVFAGRTPRAVFDAVATVQRYSSRISAYLFLLTPTYPWGAFGDRVEAAASPLPAPGWPASYPYGTGTPPPPIWVYPPMTQGGHDTGADSPPSEPRWFTGVVTNGGRAIVIIALVLGVADLARTAIPGRYGDGIGPLTHLGSTVGVVTARGHLRDATRVLSDGRCDQTTDAYCALTESQDLDAALTDLRGRVRSAPAEGGRRERVLADIEALRTASGRALDDGTLLAGGELAPPVAADVTLLDHDLDAYVDRLQRQ